MDFHLLPILTFLSIVVAASHAALPTQVYWNSVLPNTPMPKAITDFLTPDVKEDKSTSVNVGKGGVNVNSRKGKTGGGTTVGVSKGGGVNVHAGGKGKHGGGGTTVGVGKGGVNVHAGHKGKHVFVGVGKGKGRSPFDYVYAASDDQLQADRSAAIFFLEKDLVRGTKMNLRFGMDKNPATFLPRQISNSIPFSSDKLPQILKRLSVSPKSEEAEEIKETIGECEEAGMKGEKKYCATSLESMIDFSTSNLGENVEAISTEAERETEEAQEYTISSSAGVKKLGGEEAVVCHKQKYPYAVFYCHNTETTRGYTVSMVGGDGSKVKAVAVCHTDTSAWNPKHLAFQMLKVQPGTVPICHFLPQDHVIWVPK